LKVSQLQQQFSISSVFSSVSEGFSAKTAQISLNLMVLLKCL